MKVVPIHDVVAYICSFISCTVSAAIEFLEAGGIVATAEVVVGGADLTVAQERHHTWTPQNGTDALRWHVLQRRVPNQGRF